MGITYQVKGGTYQDLQGKNHPIGSLIESEEDLSAKFPNVFEAVLVMSPAVAPTLAPVVKTDDDGGDDGEEIPEGHTDVTEKFPAAVKNDLLITRDKAGYWMHDGDEIQNEKPLKQKDVAAYIKEYLGEK